MQSGDVSASSGVVWARADRPSRMPVEIATTDSFKTTYATWHRRAPRERFHRQGAVDDLPPGQESSTACASQDLADPAVTGEPRWALPHRAGRRRSISFVWSGDTAGQGWGIDESAAA